MLPGLQHHFRRAQHRLSRHLIRLCPGDPGPTGAVSHGLNEHIDIGGAGSGQGGYRVHQPLRKDGRAAGQGEQIQHELLLRFRDLRSKGKRSHSRLHRRRGIGHGPDDYPVLSQRLNIGLDRQSDGDGYNDLILPDDRRDLFQNGRHHNGLDGQQNKVCAFHRLFRGIDCLRAGAGADSLQFLPARIVGPHAVISQAKRVHQRAAHIAGSDYPDFHSDSSSRICSSPERSVIRFRASKKPLVPS